MGRNKKERSFRLRFHSMQGGAEETLMEIKRPESFFTFYLFLELCLVQEKSSRSLVSLANWLYCQYITFWILFR